MSDDDLTGGLDLLGDWLDAKGYGEEAGLCTRVMDHMHKQDARIAELEAAQERLSLFSVKIGSRVYFVCGDVAARIAALEAALKPLADMDYWITSEHDDCDTIEECNGLTVAEIRAARAAVEGKDD